jgi:hypothetical protein
MSIIRHPDTERGDVCVKEGVRVVHPIAIEKGK